MKTWAMNKINNMEDSNDCITVDIKAELEYSCNKAIELIEHVLLNFKENVLDLKKTSDDIYMFLIKDRNENFWWGFTRPRTKLKDKHIVHFGAEKEFNNETKINYCFTLKDEASDFYNFIKKIPDKYWYNNGKAFRVTRKNKILNDFYLKKVRKQRKLEIDINEIEDIENL